MMATAKSTGPCRIAPLILGAALMMAGCDEWVIAPERCPENDGCVLPPVGNIGSVVGVVRERTAQGSRPVSGLQLWAWVQLPTFGYVVSHRHVTASGEYTFPNLPPSMIVLQASGSDYDQPCAAVFQLEDSARVDIEIVSRRAPIVDSSPPSPAVSGMVYEIADGRRQPVPGARVFVEVLGDVVAATTTTDSHGRYSLCRLPAISGFITPWKDGYVLTHRPIAVAGVTQIDLEMKKE